jgi:Cu+-exporting ATPase
MVSAGMGAEHGILIRDAQALETAQKLSTVVLDKTGTITRGAPALTDVIPLSGWSEADLLQLVASAESSSEHPLATAIVSGARTRNIVLADPDSFESVTGKGVRATIGRREVLVGNDKLLTDAAVSTAGLDETASRLAGDGKTPVLVAIDGLPSGVVAVADTIKDDSVAAISALRQLGLEVVMITGDNRKTAAAIARQAGIRRVLAEVLPERKAAEIQRLQGEHRLVAMVGDGINDAPALAAATVGVAMGAHGTAISAEAADIVLLVDDISRLGDAVAISRRMRRIALQSIGVGLGLSTALMVIASFGWINPPTGAVMQEALDAAVILNALRVR